MFTLLGVLSFLLSFGSVLSDQVLVFGDSWGVYGWPYLQDMLTSHGTNLTVKNYAIGGTTSTFWARDPTIISDLVDLNPDVEYIWLSIGGNDVIDFFPNCTLMGKTMDQCITELLPQVITNTRKFLDPVFKNHPNVRLFQLGYDILNLAMNAFCEIVGTEMDYHCLDVAGCINPYFVQIQYLYVNEMPQYYQGYNYTALDVLGSLQTFGNVTYASLQHPDLEYWSPKELMMENCIHPNEKGFPVIWKNVWDLYFSKFFEK